MVPFTSVVLSVMGAQFVLAFLAAGAAARDRWGTVAGCLLAIVALWLFLMAMAVTS